MKTWDVELPGGKHYKLESDTPHDDLEAMGYTAYALVDFAVYEHCGRRPPKLRPIPPK